MHRYKTKAMPAAWHHRLVMPDPKFDPLTAHTLSLLHGSYAEAIDRILEDDETLEEFPYTMPRDMMINEIKLMEAWISEHNVNGAGDHPDKA